MLLLDHTPAPVPYMAWLELKGSARRPFNPVGRARADLRAGGKPELRAVGVVGRPVDVPRNGRLAITPQVPPPLVVPRRRSGLYQSSVETITCCAFCASTLMPPAIPPQFAAGGVTLVQVLPDSFQTCPTSVTPDVL